MSDVGLVVKGYEGLYTVTSEGEVFNCPRLLIDSMGRKTQKKLQKRKLKVTEFGYNTITLRKDGEYKTHFVHRLVFEAFETKIPKGKQINHIDGDKLNNKLSNLELVTQKENIAHAIRTGLIKPRKGHTFTKVKLSDKQREEIVASEKTNKELSEIYGCNVKTIYNIKRRSAHAIPD